MRFVSKLTMAVAAIFFALSVSAHAGGHDTKSSALGAKIYQVCKKWRVDQGGWLPTDQMQHCRNVLFCHQYFILQPQYVGFCMNNLDNYADQNTNLSNTAREAAKTELGFYN